MKPLRRTLLKYRGHPGSFAVMLLVLLSAVLTVGVLFSLLGYILIRGIPQLTPSLFSLTYTTENVSMLPAILNTVTMTGVLPACWRCRSEWDRPFTLWNTQSAATGLSSWCG